MCDFDVVITSGMDHDTFTETVLKVLWEQHALLFKDYMLDRSTSGILWRIIDDVARYSILLESDLVPPHFAWLVQARIQYGLNMLRSRLPLNVFEPRTITSSVIKGFVEDINADVAPVATNGG